MIDTIRLKSPYISWDLYDEIKKKSLTRLAINGDYEILYEFTTNELIGSFDNRIMLKLEKQEYKKVFYPSDLKWKTQLVDSEPYIELEFSIHKFFLGHNIFGGSDDLKNMLLNFELFLHENISDEIPSILEWEIVRLDYAEVFKIDFLDDFFYLMNNSNFPRRKVIKYPDSIYIPGSTTTLKFYDKYREFLKHGKKKIVDKEFLSNLIDFSKGILRVEVEVKRRKFIYDNNKLFKVSNFDINYIKNIYDMEVKKIMNIREENQLITEYRDVKDYLFKNFSNSMARSLMMTYTNLSILGELETKKMMKKSTYYDHRKILINSSISWENSDLRLKNSKVIKFLPYRDSKYCIDIDCIKPLLKRVV